MAVAAILAAALTDHSARSKGLYLDGLDVIVAPGTRSYGVPIETIEVEENGPGGVSAMQFAIDDPLKLVTVAEGMAVRYVDLVNDYTIFDGWVSHWDVVPDFGQQGRTIVVSCDGVEILLDWAKVVGTFTFPVGSSGAAAAQALVAACSSGPIRAFVSSAVQSTQAQPIASNPQLTVDVTTGGKSLRECLRDVLSACTQSTGGTSTGSTFTLDFDFGLRVWTVPLGLELPLDWGQLTLSDVGANNPEGLTASIDTSPVIRAVYITGGNAAGTGWVTDGTGLPGETVIGPTDATILTAEARQAAGAAYLAQFAVTIRGTLTLQDRAPATTVHAGGRLNLTNAAAGLAASAPDTSYRIGSIRKRFLPSTRETWEITYGGLAPSAARLMRRLTRTVVT